MATLVATKTVYIHDPYDTVTGRRSFAPTPILSYADGGGGRRIPIIKEVRDVYVRDGQLVQMWECNSIMSTRTKSMLEQKGFKFYGTQLNKY